MVDSKYYLRTVALSLYCMVRYWGDVRIALLPKIKHSSSLDLLMSGSVFEIGATTD